MRQMQKKLNVKNCAHSSTRCQRRHRIVTCYRVKRIMTFEGEDTVMIDN